MLRIIIDIGLTAGLVYVLASVLPGVRMKSFGTAVMVALVYGVLNYFLFWMLALITFIPMILSLGLFGLVINAFLLWVTDKVVEDFEIRSLGMTFLMAVFLTLGRLVIRAMV
jgi:putative membrane protein